MRARLCGDPGCGAGRSRSSLSTCPGRRRAVGLTQASRGSSGGTPSPNTQGQTAGPSTLWPLNSCPGQKSPGCGLGLAGLAPQRHWVPEASEGGSLLWGRGDSGLGWSWTLQVPLAPYASEAPRVQSAGSPLRLWARALAVGWPAASSPDPPHWPASRTTPSTPEAGGEG